MSDIPSMMVSDGTATDSVADTFCSSLFANTALLVFFIVPSQLLVDNVTKLSHTSATVFCIYVVLM